MRNNRSYSNYDEKGYPELHLGYADVILLGQWDGLSNALYSLHEGENLWVQLNLDTDVGVVETYTLLTGTVEIQYEGIRRSFQLGETIDASQYEKTILFHALSDAEILIKTTVEIFEPGFFETQVLQEEADAIEKLDGYTYMHCNRIKNYSIEVWTELDMPKSQLLTLRWGAYFHDIGKLAVPLEILNKPGPLTSAEWDIMKAHTIEGAKMIRNHKVDMLRESAFIVEQHHERYDGTGYPYRLKGDDISLEASIVSVVDSFDAMTTDRIYRKALPTKDAVQELVKGRGTQFNPEVVDAFLSVLKKRRNRWE
ncbi:HD-GYP domain-containing protein [Sporosarcina sp. BI001-red]|uniref:HD-GYP domain-containing protein n=1 Tax=Sporosarcina sp. BI001-red TaxID=2282866 RepID=UPI000E240392|nr:HD-GYP domain-containing protein [Sporosarcina sp. BI001-red]REB11575.1 HD-GYP domain-containing protein [Sporosarcina sp. BI001-red]